MLSFERLESEVRSYCRTWPTVFRTARGSRIQDENGRSYLDFFAGAGALNYGHNHPALKEALLAYLAEDGVIHSLDMHTSAKGRFLERFDELVLQPRGMEYKVQFPGPTGTNAVEAALKLARKVTGRERVVSFTNAFHGMTLGSLAVTGNASKRSGAGVALGNVVRMPYENFLGDEVDSIGYLEAFLAEDGSGVDLPAAVILETVQAEGGINVASDEWLRQLAALCERYGILLIVDDIQVGCGRTGRFFSFEDAGIAPDIFCLSKSLSGYGLPMALTLMRPELDIWDPGEHNGTFRGHNPAFVTAAAALEIFWQDEGLAASTARKATRLTAGLEELVVAHPGLFTEVRGRGLIQGLVGSTPEVTGAICREAFARGLLLETAGAQCDVVKFLPPLLVDDADIDEALAIVAVAADATVETVSTELQVSGEVTR